MTEDQNITASIDGFKMRKAPRANLFMHGLLYLPNHSEPATVRIRNMARGGLMADHDGEIAKDTPIQLELRNVGLVSGRVAWSSPTQFGMQFDAEIDPELVRGSAGKSDRPKEGGAG